MELKDLYWAAGFLEGEGCFTTNRMMVGACQVQKQPIARLVSLFGGTLKQRSRLNPNSSKVWDWWITGKAAAQVMLTVFSLMSPRRKAAIKQSIKKWLKLPLDYVDRQCCPSGHKYTPENTYRKPGVKHNSRECRDCIRDRSRRRYVRKSN